MKRVGFYIFICSLFFALNAEETVSTMVYSQVLYSDPGNNPVTVTDQGGWVDMGRNDLNNFFRIPTSSSESIRKWRVSVNYLDENRTGQTTLQIRLRGEGYTTLFTLPWDQITSVPTVKESNWFIADRMAPQDFQSLLSARLISPPGAVRPGRIYSITLEAWEFTKKAERENYSYEDTLLASTRLLKPTGQTVTAPGTGGVLKADDPFSKDRAMEFAMEFVEISLYGDLPRFYRALNDEIHSLSDGLTFSKFVINPPEGVSAVWSMEDYKDSYDYKIYSFDEYSELFPEWFENREWTPDRRCFLFMGNSVKEDKFPFFKEEELLVFMVRKEGSNWKVIGRPEL